MLNTIDEDEKLVRTIFVSGQNREMWFLTEDGLYENSFNPENLLLNFQTSDKL